MTPELSIIICSYNPRPEILAGCLSAVREALQEVQDAEVIIVDNNSSVPIESMDVCREFVGEPFRHVIEREQGLTPARLRGISEAVGQLLVFVDDDNIVSRDFFRQGLRIAAANESIGSFSGNVSLSFEVAPPAWSIPYHGLLVERTVSRDVWSNLPHLTDTMPCGAGLYVRRSVADHYRMLHETGRRAIQLDRSAGSLFSGGDNDLAACACDIGLGVGLFSALRIRHHIPAGRLELGYLLKLTRGIYASSIVFKSFRGEMPIPYTRKRRILDLARLLLMRPIPRAFYREQLRGEEEGRRMVAPMSDGSAS